VFDAGSGLVPLSHATSAAGRFPGLKRVHILMSHAHMDHWEGLKDCDWLWRFGNGLELILHGPDEALTAVRDGHGPPSFVALEVLAEMTLGKLEFRPIGAGKSRRIADAKLTTFSLNHYSGDADSRRDIDALGYRVETTAGATVCYLCDHQPTPQTTAAEDRAMAGADLAIWDAHFGDRAQQMFGHGSQEHAADVAHRFPRAVILAGHHGAAADDSDIRAAGKRHGKGVENYVLAREGMTWRWDGRRRRFVDQGRSR